MVWCCLGLSEAISKNNNRLTPRGAAYAQSYGDRSETVKGKPHAGQPNLNGRRHGRAENIGKGALGREPVEQPRVGNRLSDMPCAADIGECPLEAQAEPGVGEGSVPAEV